MKKYCAITFFDNSICPNCNNNTLYLVDEFGRRVNNNLLNSQQLYTEFNCNQCGAIFGIEWTITENENKYYPVPLLNKKDTINKFVKNFSKLK